MGKYLTQIETDFISKTVNLNQQNISVMDVGAEAGRFSTLVANKKATVVSVDLDLYSLKRLKLKNKEVHVIQADARKLPIKEGVFDLVFMIEVLDYIPELKAAFSECKRTLKPNADSVLSFGNKSSVKAKLKAMQGKPYRHSYREVMQCLLETELLVHQKLGYSWMLFGRTSQSSLIPVSAVLERGFGFRRLVRFSPWVIVHVTKPL